MTYENILLSEPVVPETSAKPRTGPAALARSEGRVELTFRRKEGGSKLAHLYQRGCGRVRFPTVDHADYPEAVLINTAGGLTGGDHMSYLVRLEEGAGLTVSGQAAEKIYRSVGSMATIEAEMHVGKKAILEWLPQETILFEKSRLRRMNRLYLEAGSRLIALEATLFGRTAHGEVLRSASLRDGWKIWRDGRLLWLDNFVLEGDIHGNSLRPAVLDGAKGMATILIADDDAENYLEAARETARECGVRAAVTSREELLIVRVLANSGYELRKSLTQILTKMRTELTGHSVELPKVWENQ
ncbi:urease accessory protein UreD [Sneathiella sp. CAU 1612]|uniref:Urease accessory protein UreD n=1 Tax=Sneathiella sedimenti TaxID=2816034 RepID=A0ABS3F216_9PROT|nr:urease accessory protein UreD [uncultured Sneathiella sp.]MBO0332485.1 urease accessory protein UreD [Sneathiella sedimenti]